MPEKPQDEKTSTASTTPETPEAPSSTESFRVTKRGTRIVEGTARLRREGWGFLKTRSVTPENALTGGKPAQQSPPDQ